MKDFKGFIFYNNINQKDVIEYLGVSKGYMSLVISGKKKLSEDNFRKLIENPYGWDTSMLVEHPETPTPEQTTPNNSLIDYLQRKIAELESKVDKLNDEKAELLQENAILKYENTMLTPRKGDADDAGSSLSASAV
jgi:hypothetical protein